MSCESPEPKPLVFLSLSAAAGHFVMHSCPGKPIFKVLQKWVLRSNRHSHLHGPFSCFGDHMHIAAAVPHGAGLGA